MIQLQELLNSGKIDSKKRLRALVELLYNKNGRLVTSNLNHINASYDLKELIPTVSIKRVSYSIDYVIELN